MEGWNHLSSAGFHDSRQKHPGCHFTSGGRGVGGASCIHSLCRVAAVTVFVELLSWKEGWMEVVEPSLTRF